MYNMKKTAFILGAAMVATPVVEAQAYADTLDYTDALDLSAILAAYDVGGDYGAAGGDSSSDSPTDYNIEISDIYDSAVDSAAYSDSSEYEEVGPVDVEFGDYPSGFDEQYFDGDKDADQPDFTDERLRPNKLEFEFDGDGNLDFGDALTKLAQAGVGSHDGTDFNNCRVCNGQTAAQCVASDVVETCNDAQPVCQVTVRIARKGADPLYWSECKAKKSCYDDETQNFSDAGSRFDQCRSTNMAARFFHQSKCTFCMKMGTGTTELLFKDTTDADDATKLLTTDGTTQIDIADALADPRTYFLEGAGSYIFDSQTWYAGNMDSP
jgi:hypothetical protein